MPDVKTLKSNVICPMFEATKCLVISKFESPPALALTCDLWTSGGCDLYMTFTCHLINDSFEVEEFVLTTVEMTVSHTSPNLLSVTQDVLKDWGISDTKEITFVTDNAAVI